MDNYYWKCYIIINLTSKSFKFSIQQLEYHRGLNCKSRCILKRGIQTFEVHEIIKTNAWKFDKISTIFGIKVKQYTMRGFEGNGAQGIARLQAWFLGKQNLHRMRLVNGVEWTFIIRFFKIATMRRLFGNHAVETGIERLRSATGEWQHCVCPNRQSSWRIELRTCLTF